MKVINHCIFYYKSVKIINNVGHQQSKQSPKRVHFNQDPDNSVVRVDIVDDVKTPDEEAGCAETSLRGPVVQSKSIPRVANLHVLSWF